MRVRAAAVAGVGSVVMALGVVTAALPKVENTAASTVLRAGRSYQTLGPLELRNRRRSVTYADAIRAFGRPSSCRRFASPANGEATWRSLGLRLRLATLGGMPAGENGCTAPHLIHIDYAYVTQARWRTTKGLRVGDSIDELATLYPNARFQRRRIGSWPAPAYWILHVRERCFIGICESEYARVPRLTAEVRGGRVSGFFFPVGAQGE